MKKTVFIHEIEGDTEFIGMVEPPKEIREVIKELLPFPISSDRIEYFELEQKKGESLNVHVGFKD